MRFLSTSACHVPSEGGCLAFPKLIGPLVLLGGAIFGLREAHICHPDAQSFLAGASTLPLSVVLPADFHSAPSTGPASQLGLKNRLPSRCLSAPFQMGWLCLAKPVPNLVLFCAWVWLLWLGLYPLCGIPLLLPRPYHCVAVASTLPSLFHGTGLFLHSRLLRAETIFSRCQIKG